MVSVEEIKKARIKAKNRGVKIRYVTKITEENISYCKELSKFSEIRHLDGVKGNFEVSQKVGEKGEYVATATLQEAEPIAQLIYSDVKEIVEQQQFVFDTLWKKAIPSEVRIKEIEEGIKPETIEVIVNPKEALEREYRLLKSAKEEIQIIYSAVNTFHMQEKQLGITRILSNLSKQGVSIKILTPIDNQVKELIADLKEQAEGNQQQRPYQTNTSTFTNNNNSTIDIQDIAPSSSINSKIIVADKRDSLAMEIKDGITDDLHATIGLSTFSNSKSTVASYSAIFENLSKQNQLYKQLKDAYKIVENTNAIQKEFIDIAAHELKTPIMPILGYAELLLEDETDDNKRQALMGIINNSERLRKLASDVLDIAKMDSNTFRLYKEPINLNYLISNIVKDYLKRQEQGKARDITRLISNVNDNGHSNKNNDDDDNKSKKSETKLFFESTVKEDIFVEADKDRIMQVMYNLLDNAFKFTDFNGGSVRITLEKQEQQTEERTPQKQESENAIISIKDTGIGIDPEILPRLFSKFASKSFEGTGLGLFISKSIIEAHGGKMWAENNVDGNGATFSFSLPLIEEEQQQLKNIKQMNQ
jgi:two-component system, OmpR family, sensor histidine kinase VicK